MSKANRHRRKAAIRAARINARSPIALSLAAGVDTPTFVRYARWNPPPTGPGARFGRPRGASSWSLRHFLRHLRRA